MIQLGPILMVCVWCRARPGVLCRYKGEPLSRGRFHSVRERDAREASKLIAELDPVAFRLARVDDVKRALTKGVKSPKPGTIPFHYLVSQVLRATAI